jgi:hypothetical protein
VNARKPKQTPNFRRVIADLGDGLVLKPLISAALFDGRIPPMTIEVGDDHPLDFGPDGWFHPSTHPLLPARQLWFYIREPDAWITQPLQYMGAMSVTMGKLAHDIIRGVMWDAGVLEAPAPGDDEPVAEDEALGARGRYDGRLRLLVPAFPAVKVQGFEFKTASPLTKFPDDLDLVAWKEKYPQYYAQIQEYLRMEGLELMIVIMLAMGYPWEMREFHIPYDPILAEGVAEKYRTVRALLAEGEMPPPCCGPGSATARNCPARAVCPVALA